MWHTALGTLYTATPTLYCRAAGIVGTSEDNSVVGTRGEISVVGSSGNNSVILPDAQPLKVQVGQSASRDCRQSRRDAGKHRRLAIPSTTGGMMGVSSRDLTHLVPWRRSR